MNKSYLVLSYAKGVELVAGMEPRILYSGPDETKAEELRAHYEEAYRGYHIVKVTVDIPMA